MLEKVFDIDIPALRHGNYGLIYTCVSIPTRQGPTETRRSFPTALLIHYVSYGDSGSVLPYTKTHRRHLWSYIHHHSPIQSQTLLAIRSYTLAYAPLIPALHSLRV